MYHSRPSPPSLSLPPYLPSLPSPPLPSPPLPSSPFLPLVTQQIHCPFPPKQSPSKTLTSFNIDVTNWEVCALDRPLWRGMIHTGVRTAETNRISEAQKKLAKRDFTLPPAPQPARHTHAPSVEECFRPELD